MQFPLLAALLIAFTLSSCGGESPVGPVPVPTPEPSTSPSPPPSSGIAFPLRVSGSRFVDATGKPVYLLGAIAVDKSWGWPGRSRMDRLADAGANFTHLRLGPQSSHGPDPEMDPENGLMLAEAAASEALGYGIAVEVDILDGWVMKHEFNWFGWDCGTTAMAPLVAQKQWAEKAARALSGYPNVMFETSNEGFDCPHFSGSSKDWEFGIRDAIRRGAPGHLIGTNSHGGQIEKGFDYIERHQDSYLPRFDRPAMVNESGPNLTCEDWFHNARMAKGAGTSFHLWWGDMSEVDFLACLYKIGEV